MARTSPGLRWAGWGDAASLVRFLLSNFTISVLQPAFAALACAAAVVIALGLPSAVQ